jgi:predicted transcriptional regulator
VVEGVVDFDGVEMLRVILEPFVLGQIGGIEPLPPVVVIPAGRADPNIAIRLAHMHYSTTWNIKFDLWACTRYNNFMTRKEIAIKSIQDLPDSVTWADIEERIRFLAVIDKGLADIKSGKIIPHKEVKESLKRWLS